MLTLTDRLKSEGYEVGAASDGPSGLRSRHARTLGRHPARRHAAGRERLRRLPRPAAARRRHADHHADGARPGRRQGAGPQARRRRLPDQAVRHARAAGAHRSAIAARAARPAPARSRTTFGDITVDFRKAEVTRSGQPLDLSAREFLLLKYFIEHREATLTRDELLNEVWGYHSMPSTRTVDVHVAWLRQKIEPNPRQPQYVLTMHGMGYKFVG